MGQITDEYKATIVQYRSGTSPSWGSTGDRNFGYRLLNFLNMRPDVKTVLDFGCGHGKLGGFITENRPDVVWEEYDPSIEGKDKLPNGHYDLICSSDVMEHIEPECLNEVLDWLNNHAKYQYHLISCELCAGSELPDGRNAHLIVETPEWWRETFKPFGVIMFWSKEEIRKRGRMAPYCSIQID